MILSTKKLKYSTIYTFERAPVQEQTHIETEFLWTSARKSEGAKNHAQANQKGYRDGSGYKRMTLNNTRT